MTTLRATAIRLTSCLTSFLFLHRFASAQVTPPTLPTLAIATGEKGSVHLTLAGTSAGAATNFVFETSASVNLPYWERLTDGVDPVEIEATEAELGLFRIRLSDYWLARQDSDGDGMDDDFERRHPQFLSLAKANDALADWDRDGRSNQEEYLAGTDPDDFSGQLAAASGRRFALKGDARLWSWNSPTSEVAGGSPAPVDSSAAPRWRSVAASTGHVLTVTELGELWAWGENSGGELGDGTQTPHLTPTRIGTESDWSLVAAGHGISSGFSVALKRDGSLWQWGDGLNAFGSPEPNVSTTRPQRLGTGQTWRTLSVGTEHVVAIQADGTLWQWGQNYLGAFGFDGTAGTSWIEPRQVGHDTSWRQAIAGGSFSLAIRQDGSLWAWGNLPLEIQPNSSSQPLPLLAEGRWRTAVVLDSAVFALRDDGTLWAWGQLPTASGQMRSVSKAEALHPSQRWQTLVAESTGFAGAATTALARRDDGTLWQLSPRGEARKHRRPWRADPNTDWSSVSAGPGWSLGLRRNGTLWTWGSAPYLPTNPAAIHSPASVRPVEPGTTWSHASTGRGRGLGARRDGSLWQWGLSFRYFGGAFVGGGTIGGGNEHGGGSPGTWVPAESPEPVWIPTRYEPARNWAAFAQGEDHGVGIEFDGSLWVWGKTPRPARETVSTRAHANTPVRLGTENSWVKATVGRAHSLALTENGDLWAWGDNDAGQLGDGTQFPRTDPVRVGAAAFWKDIAGGEVHSLAIAQDSSLWAWGNNAHGQLGVPGLPHSSSPIAVAGDRRWQRVFAGGTSSFAIAEDGSLWAWGDNGAGQLGVGDATTVTAPVPVDSSRQWRELSAGPTHTLAVKDDGTLWAWGSASGGQIPDDAITVNVVPVDSATDW